MGRLLSRCLPIPGLLIVVGCGLSGGHAGGQLGGAHHVAVRTSEFKFEPANVTAKANQPVRVTVSNTGVMAHDWVIQGLDQQIQTRAEPGQSVTIEFTPTRAGTFRIICVEPGHEPAGMVGQLVVRE